MYVASTLYVDVLTDVEPVSRLLFLNSNITTSAAVAQQLSPRALRMVENHARPLRCIAVGGYPPPSIEIHIGRRDVSTRFKFINSVSLTSGVPGLRHMNIQSERWNDEFEVSADDDDAVIKCVAVVPGLKPTEHRIQLHVDCKFIPLV